MFLKHPKIAKAMAATTNGIKKLPQHIRRKKKKK